MLKHGGKDVQEEGNCKVVRCTLIRKRRNDPNGPTSLFKVGSYHYLDEWRVTSPRLEEIFGVEFKPPSFS